MKRLLDAQELAEVLSIPRGQVYRLTRRGDIPVVAAGWHYRYDLEEVIAALKRPAKGEDDDDCGCARNR